MRSCNMYVQTNSIPMARVCILSNLPQITQINATLLLCTALLHILMQILNFTGSFKAGNDELNADELNTPQACSENSSHPGQLTKNGCSEHSQTNKTGQQRFMDVKQLCSPLQLTTGCLRSPARFAQSTGDDTGPSHAQQV